MHPFLILLLVAPLSLATSPNPRILPNTLQTRQTCSSEGLASCEQQCMPFNAACCNDGSSTYCPFGNVCVTGGCCPFGKTCTGGGGTTTINNPAPASTRPNEPVPTSAVQEPQPTINNPVPGSTTTTPTIISPYPTGTAVCSSLGESICDSYCMDIDGVCCNEGHGRYCYVGQVCVSGGGCCTPGVDCLTDTGGGSMPTSTTNAGPHSLNLDRKVVVLGGLMMAGQLFAQ